MAGYFGLNLEQLSSRDYAHTQCVSARVFAMTRADDGPLLDGVFYPSRNNYPGKAVALFERAAMKVKVVEDVDLVDHSAWPGFVQRYRIGIVPLV